MEPPARPADPATVPLSSLRKGERGIVAAIVDSELALVGEAAGSTMVRRLLELGFVPGEALEVVATVWPGRDPMAVRIGASVFALRRREAQAVAVRRDARLPAP